MMDKSRNFGQNWRRKEKKKRKEKEFCSLSPSGFPGRAVSERHV
jgi:hypothetical protein